MAQFMVYDAGLRQWKEGGIPPYVRFVRFAQAGDRIVKLDIARPTDDRAYALHAINEDGQPYKVRRVDLDEIDLEVVATPLGRESRDGERVESAFGV